MHIPSATEDVYKLKHHIIPRKHRYLLHFYMPVIITLNHLMIVGKLFYNGPKLEIAIF